MPNSRRFWPSTRTIIRVLCPRLRQRRHKSEGVEGQDEAAGPRAGGRKSLAFDASGALVLVFASGVVKYVANQ